MKAMIFAAGLGTRLGELTRTKPKALADINGRTMLELTAEKLVRAGFDDLLVNIHHHPEQMLDEIERLRTAGYRITVSDERDELLDTAGGLFKARGFFDEKPFLAHNVDEFTDLDLEGMYGRHLETGALATLAVRHRPGNRMLLVDPSGRMRGWRNNATKEQIITVESSRKLEEVGFSGIQVLSPSIFNLMQEGIYSLTSLYLMLAKEHLVMTYLHDYGYWFDCGTPRNLDSIRAHLGGPDHGSAG
ncbi:MAG: nucleotidyltransferase family protein [Bacteroidales bacterium]|jgi:NDP-sugar pyrophosphorylase family protein|nr:nucleotidyltransferase family protein [Bacteroidales bacterium]MDD3735670.1 nucleotidyltransferase family protein [Bacteroidales bacterium]NLD62688.1 nucleotidyltransferase family protein [Bacteroidales bacterium]HNT92205.1 nucleotidyltransferase family protein [Bacteroidales bacterium]HOO66710.1 nucleotidyltransferase family protein [Bacteroidales bacterium]